ncbi:hypothetical protein ACROYT_G032137 [Oculina patagonica]
MFYFIQELFLWASKLTKVPVDQVRFIFCMLLCIPLGAVYRTVLHPKKASPSVRLVVSLIWGFMIGWICFESEMIILIVVSTLCYGLTWSVNPKEVHKVVFAVSFFCLLAAQVARMIMEYGENKFDYTGRLMIITQKMTYVAFSVHDGLGRKEDELSKDEKEQSIKRVPSLLEYFGFMFHHSMLLAGPACTFQRLPGLYRRTRYRACYRTDKKGTFSYECCFDQAWFQSTLHGSFRLFVKNISFPSQCRSSLHRQ